MDQFWTWAKTDGRYAYVAVMTGAERCTYLEKYLWSELGNSMWRKHIYVFQYHVKYIQNDILKPFRVDIIQYDECFRVMQNIAKYQWRGMIMIKQIGNTATKSSLSMIFEFQQGTTFQHICSMKWMINKRTIDTFPTKNGMTSCPTWRKKTTKSELRLKSKYLRLLRQIRPTLTEIRAQRFHAIREKGLVS